MPKIIEHEETTTATREQIWALLYFLEFQSGGIEGRFPPSLYPRMRSDMPDG